MVPIEREGSVDEDLLGTRSPAGIEEHPRQQVFRTPCRPTEPSRTGR